jgi:hypothetical protein
LIDETPIEVESSMTVSNGRNAARRGDTIARTNWRVGSISVLGSPLSRGARKDHIKIVLNEVDSWPVLGGVANFSPEFTSTAVNQNAPRYFPRVLSDLNHIRAKLLKVTKGRGVLFALHDDGDSAFVNEQDIHPSLATTSTLPSLLKRIWEKAVLEAVRERGDVAGERPLVVEVRP